MGRGRAGADAGTDKAGRRGRTRETTPDQGGPTPRGIEAEAGGGGAKERGRAGADAGTGGRRGAGGPAATPRTPPGTGSQGGV